MKKTGSLLTLVLFSKAVFALTVQPFSLPQMNAEEQGTNYNSADHASAVFVVENYFLNCPYCNDNAPNVDDLAGYFAENPRVQVLDVGIDKSDSQYATWIEKHNPNHPVLNDARKELTRQLGTTGYPSTYVIDCNGNVAMKTTGVWSSSTMSKLKSKIKSLLRRPCVRD